ncbi:winged helix-turn-helix domain-containing protein [Bacillus thuringiensis serovar shandongiensis]|uniref:winged helix-turn-helix domain-containing protein n=1 Tax=Bacillus toyonensis TaxID=155322 RepID=UPI000B448D03|nr:winged helix-turn-helix domain-containing protein [Bacillus toyonensis]MEC2392629.1 winged helix-turn-helix domain-containing protein [Bacillus toyonensis]OTX40560.1 winged helix-turn-helix domain-containing protein [Bacillus thuringiensis serovar malayensis]OUB04979.1 winged helix-turn-helix domain-containing protein [Bacillus thuringiensis serovar shandongiensis]
MDKTWENYLSWRTQKGYTGLSTQEQYEEFLQEVNPTDDEKMSKEELAETEEFFEGVSVKDKVLATFEAVNLVATLGGQMTYDDLAQQTGYSLRTVKNHIKELDEKGYISIKRGVHANSYFIGVDMRAKTKKKKTIEFEERMTFESGCKDISGEVTIKDGINETHVSYYNVGVLLDRTQEFLREADGLGELRGRA